MANEGVVCGKWGKKSKAVLEEAALAVKLLFQTCDFFLHMEKKCSRNRFCIKRVFQHLYSVPQCFYHYHS